MKKSLIIIVLAGLMTLAACKKDKESQGEAMFTATTEHQGGRTSLDPNNGQINWTTGDQIVIGNDNNETAVFTLQSGEGTTEGGFGTSGEFNTVGPFIAAYPSTAEIVGDVVTFNLPATQAIGETHLRQRSQPDGDLFRRQEPAVQEPVRRLGHPLEGCGCPCDSSPHHIKKHC